MKAFLLSLLLAALPVAAFAGTTDVTIAWDANAEPDLAGYRIYQSARAGGPYTLAREVGLVTEATLPGLADGDYCWVVSAYDSVGNESAYSAEVCRRLDATAPAPPGGVRITVTVTVTVIR